MSMILVLIMMHDGTAVDDILEIHKDLIRKNGIV